MCLSYLHVSAFPVVFRPSILVRHVTHKIYLQCYGCHLNKYSHNHIKSKKYFVLESRHCPSCCHCHCDCQVTVTANVTVPATVTVIATATATVR